MNGYVNGSSKASVNSDTTSRRSIDSQGSSSRFSNEGDGGIMSWRCRNRKIRDIGVGALQRIDGAVSAARWGRPVDPRFTDDDDEEAENESNGSVKAEKTLHPSYSADDLHKIVEEEETAKINTTPFTPLTRKPSAHASVFGHGGRRGRSSIGETTPVETRRQEF